MDFLVVYAVVASSLTFVFFLCHIISEKNVEKLEFEKFKGDARMEFTHIRHEMTGHVEGYQLDNLRTHVFEISRSLAEVQKKLEEKQDATKTG